MRDDLILVREVANVKAQIAGYGKVQRKFNMTADETNKKRQLKLKVTSKSVPDLYRKVQEAHEKGERMSRAK